MKQLYSMLLAFLYTFQSYAAAPTVPASNLSFNIIEGSFLNIGWTAGNGTRRIIVAKAGSAVTAVPQNGVDYQENTVFGNGQQIAPGQYVVYDNAFTSFYLTGLQPNTEYYFAIFEYNGTGAAIEYNTAATLTGHSFTAKSPTIATSQIVFSNIKTNAVTMSLTAGNGSKRLVVAREADAVNAEPVVLHPYSGNSIFGSGAQVGNGNYSINSSSATVYNISNLKQGTTYHFAVFEYNGNSEPVYLIPGITASITTRTVPTVASSSLLITRADGKELTMQWTKGNGQRRIVVAKQGSDITGTPVNGIDYAANSNFGSGATVAAGEYVVYNGTGNSLLLSNLQPNTNYYLRIYEYDGTGIETSYLVSGFAAANSVTAATPVQQSVGIVTSNIQANSALLSWQNGSGRARLIVMRKGTAVDVQPQDFTTYAASILFGSGQQLGDGNFVINTTTDAFTTVQNLQANSTYHVAVFEYNGFNQPLYKVPGTTYQFTTAGSLPVVLSSFSIAMQYTKAILQWTTQTEINSKHFKLQRSADGVHFQTIQIIAARGNSTTESFYSTSDLSPLFGISFYRLEMQDKDGSSKFSPVVKLNNDSRGKIVILNGAGYVSARINAPHENKQWLLYNASGQLLQSTVHPNNEWKISTTELSSGMYFITVNGNGISCNARFVK